MKTLLKNGLVFDGSNAAPVESDVLIEDDRIIKVAKNIDCETDEVIDCTGLHVAPGFIDAHSHNDYFATREDATTCIKPFVMQGITTQIVGNCGFSVIGVDKEVKNKELLDKTLFQSDAYGSLEDVVKKFTNKLDINLVPLVGHGSARISASGMKAGKLTAEETKTMCDLLERDLKAGAWGGSYGLMYEPGMFADKAELIEFAKIVKKYDGILTIHPRACSNTSQGFPLTKKHHLELGLDEFTDVLKASGARGEYSHLIFTGAKSWPRVDSMLSKFKEAKEVGLQIGYDMYSYTFGASVITIFLNPDFLALPIEKRMKGFPYLKAFFLMSISMKVLGMTFDDVKIAYIGNGYEKYEGMKLLDVAKEENLSPVKTYFKLVNVSNGKGRLYIDKYYNKEIIERLMKEDDSIFMTDAWYEDKGVQQASCFTCYPHFFELAKEFGINEEIIVNKMSGKIADRYKLVDRGYLKEGYKADITIYKDFKVNSEIEAAEGLHYVFMNGKKTVDNGKFIEAKAGEFILKKVNL